MKNTENKNSILQIEKKKHQEKKRISRRSELLSLYFVGVKPPLILRIFLPKN